MDFFEYAISNIEYRDPLFGIVILIFCIGLVSLFGYYWNYIISKKQQESLRKFMESFDYIGFDKEVKEFLALSPNPIPSLLFMAKMYQKSANYEKAIRLYTTLLDSIKNPLDKIPILESLGLVYTKAGFPLRAKEIYLEILHHYPRNPVTLNALIKIYEELNAFEDALNALDCLEEIQGGTQLHQSYLQTKILIFTSQNHTQITQKQLPAKLLATLKKEPRLMRLIMTFLKDYYPSLFWQCVLEIPQDSLLQILDLLWSQKEIPQEILEELENLPTQANNLRILKEILEAKGILSLSASQKAIFELEALCLLRANKSYQGDLRFSYQCTNCSGTSPLAFDRCPHCDELLTSKTLVFLKEKQDEVCYSFL
ncbi:tetratricopeptide repeat protein [Helicobacter sp. MIT 11-5569]|uniref:tetratricopeptide repeat protein n=1 Tax=Helicobacter sp. MIT 11-5569 TaxID=1548151 RepID=UPI00051FA839|nr:tetratricopeptide repeat protein [Helicobacter sp. MIT 11-5569]TLD85280.1 tetratricopeptide repeat protein [Helicobacter sp. MIT 11-5569]